MTLKFFIETGRMGTPATYATPDVDDHGAVITTEDINLAAAFDTPEEAHTLVALRSLPLGMEDNQWRVRQHSFL